MGVGISEKVIGSELTAEPCVTVYVVAKVPKSEIEEAALVPAEIKRIPTDVVETGEFRALPFRGRYRPAAPGVSLGHYQISAGTFGCLVKRKKLLCILSNNHVLANINQGKPGDPILQPGPYDGGQNPADVIATLTDFVPIQFGSAINDVDCAIAEVIGKTVTAVPTCDGKIVPSPSACSLNLLVKKCGRTTQFTRGKGDRLSSDCSGRLWRKRQRAFSQPDHRSIADSEAIQPAGRFWFLDRHGRREPAGGASVRRRPYTHDSESHRRGTLETRSADRRVMLLSHSKHLPRILATSIMLCTAVVSAMEIGGVMNEKQPPQKRSIQEVKAQHELELLKIQGVQGVGIGRDERKGQPVIKVYIDKKTKDLEERIPSELEGYPVQIEISGEFHAF